MEIEQMFKITDGRIGYFGLSSKIAIRPVNPKTKKGIIKGIKHHNPFIFSEKTKPAAKPNDSTVKIIIICVQ